MIDKDSAQVLLWLGVPAALAPRVGQSVAEDGKSFEITSVTPSNVHQGTVNIVARTEWTGDEPQSILIVGAAAWLRIGELLAVL